MHAIFVGSGKGGVGKSTTAAVMALFLARNGVHVGLLDADLAGPSLPVLFGHYGPVTVEDGMMIPVVIDRVQSMSTGYLAPQDRAIVWSGAMLEGALWQMIHETRWAHLDLMIIDLPPGTNELHLKIVEEFHDDATVILVSNEDPLSAADTARALDFFTELNLTPAVVAVTAVGRRGRRRVKPAGKPYDMTKLGIGTHEIPIVQIPNSPMLTPPLTDAARIASRKPSHNFPEYSGDLSDSLLELATLCGIRISI
jgi:Mrp family chromosome partitioning ATPase